MLGIERKITDWIRRYYFVIFGIFAFIAGLKLRKMGLEFVSSDFQNYLQPWYDTMKANTGFKGLVLDFYTYYIPYMCLIAIATYFESLDYMLYLKVISVMAELVCACFGGICAYRLLRDKKEGKLYAAIAFAIIWLSPTTIMNGAFWGQCDYIYTAFIFVSIWAMLREKYRLAFVFLGIAFAFKLQAIFILPAYVVYYFCSRKFPITRFLYIPLCYLIGGLPAILEGKSIKDTYGIYVTQSHGFGQLSMNIPNIYRFLTDEGYNFFYSWGVAATMLIFCILAGVVFYRDYRIDERIFLIMCAVSAGICCMFLPEMHERYSVLFIMLSYLYFIVYDRRKVILAGILDGIATITYCHCLYGLDLIEHYKVFAVINLLILFYMIVETVIVCNKKKAGISA